MRIGKHMHKVYSQDEEQHKPIKEVGDLHRWVWNWHYFPINSDLPQTSYTQNIQNYCTRWWVDNFLMYWVIQSSLFNSLKYHLEFLFSMVYRLLHFLDLKVNKHSQISLIVDTNLESYIRSCQYERTTPYLGVLPNCPQKAV